jgi:CheY-like chemotaxis protein
MKARILCIEDDKKWRSIVHATLKRIGPMSVDNASTYDRALRFLESKTYDLVTLDSRLGRTSRMTQLLSRIEEIVLTKPRPATVAVTHYMDDVSAPFKSMLFGAIDKNDAAKNDKLLQRSLLGGLQWSIGQQARFAWRKCEGHISEPMPVSDRRLYVALETFLPTVPVSRQREMRSILEKRRLYFPTELSSSKIVFECEGYTTSLHDNTVEAVLQLTNGSSITRLFDRDRFVAAGLQFEGARFRYVISQDSAGAVHASLKPAGTQRPPLHTNLAVFDAFQPDS